MDYTVSDLTKLLEVLTEMNRTGVKVNQEINMVLGLTLLNLGIPTETVKEQIDNRNRA